MSNYKIIIGLLIFILLGSVFWWMNSKIESLEYDLLKAQSTIEQTDSKIKEQLTENNILMSDLEIRENTILALQEQINKNKNNVDSLLQNKINLDNIYSIGKETNVVDEISLGGVTIVDKQTGEEFINLRNNIIVNYQ